MSVAAIATAVAERASLPDVLTRLGVGLFVRRARRSLSGESTEFDEDFAEATSRRPIAEVVTADMNDFFPETQFNRIVSVEMFEHMANWRALLERIATWLAHDGRDFLHVFSHRGRPYRFDAEDRADWIGRYFFTGGVMPSEHLIRQFDDLFQVEEEWRWSGRHYARTARAWLANFDRRRDEIQPILARTYGTDAGLWRRRWRLFFLATAGLFGAGGGDLWGVSHYRLAPVQGGR